MAAPVHQDNYYWNISKDNGITIRIALDKSTKKMGHYTILVVVIR